MGAECRLPILSVSSENRGNPAREETRMKKKNHFHVPDFSSKRPAAPGVSTGSETPKPKAPIAPTSNAGKPHATSKKSGRRGG